MVLKVIIGVALRRCSVLWNAVLGIALALVIVATSTSLVSAACNPPKFASTYNPATGNYAYWTTRITDPSAVILGRLWSGGTDYTGTCNDGTQTFFEWGVTPGTIGMSMSLGNACVPAGRCPSGSLTVEARVTDSSATDQQMLMVKVPETPLGGVNFDFSTPRYNFCDSPRPIITNLTSNGTTKTASVSIGPMTACAFGGALQDITGWNILSKPSSSDPGVFGSYALRGSFAVLPGAHGAISGTVQLDCSNPALDQWLTAQLLTVAPVNHQLGPTTRVSCRMGAAQCAGVPDGTTCDDGDPSTIHDQCRAGVCSASTQCYGFQKTYDIGASLLDNLSGLCDGNERSRYNGCQHLSYGFHWTDVSGGLPITRVDALLNAGFNCDGTSSDVTFNGVPVLSFFPVNACACSPSGATVSLPDLPLSAYAQGGINAISIAPGGDCGGLAKSTSLGDAFARVTVTYALGTQCQHEQPDSVTGICVYSSLPDGTPCNDNNACTTGDSCEGGVCAGTPAAGPPETPHLTVAADKATYSWAASADTTRYDVVRGSLAAFPIGPGGGDESCFGNVPGLSVIDPAIPVAGSGFWYLSRGGNSCGTGTFGDQSDGTPRTTTTCP